MNVLHREYLGMTDVNSLGHRKTKITFIKVNMSSLILRLNYRSSEECLERSCRLLKEESLVPILEKLHDLKFGGAGHSRKEQ